MKRLLTLLCLLASVALVMAETTNEVEVKANGVVTRVSFYTPEIVRVVKCPGETITQKRNSLVVTLAPQTDIDISVKEAASKVVMSSEKLSVMIDKRTGQLQFMSKGKNLLKEKSSAFEQRTKGLDAGAYRVTQSFVLDKDEAIYGLGTIQDGKLNRRGIHQRMEQSNLEDFQNVLQSIKGWGIYWENYSPTDFDDDALKGMSFSSEVGDDIDYYFMYGGSADGVIAQMRHLSGDVPMFPLWTYGFWQSKERYKTAAETESIVDKYRELQVPLDGIIQDWQYWGSNYLWNAMDFLAEDFATGQQLIKNVHQKHAHFMISIWASFGPQTQQFRELDEKGLLLPIETWPQTCGKRYLLEAPEAPFRLWY